MNKKPPDGSVVQSASPARWQYIVCGSYLVDMHGRSDDSGVFYDCFPLDRNLSSVELAGWSVVVPNGTFRPTKVEGYARFYPGAQNG